VTLSLLSKWATLFFLPSSSSSSSFLPSLNFHFTSAVFPARLYDSSILSTRTLFFFLCHVVHIFVTHFLAIGTHIFAIIFHVLDSSFCETYLLQFLLNSLFLEILSQVTANPEDRETKSCIISAPSPNAVQRYNPRDWTTTLLRTCVQ